MANGEPGKRVSLSWYDTEKYHISRDKRAWLGSEANKRGKKNQIPNSDRSDNYKSVVEITKMSSISIASSQQSFLTNALTPLINPKLRTRSTPVKTTVYCCCPQQQQSPTPRSQNSTVSLYITLSQFMGLSCFSLWINIFQFPRMKMMNLTELANPWYNVVGGAVNVINRKNEKNKLGKLAMVALAAWVLTLGSVHDASAAKTGGRVGGQAFRSSAPRSSPRINNNSR